MQVTTLKTTVSQTGIGLHTGGLCTLIFNPPALPRQGVFFKKNGFTISAAVENIVSTERGTTLGQNNQSISTVEHLLAALRYLGLRRVQIDIEGEEIPNLDGSAKPWIELLKPHLETTSENFPIRSLAAPIEIREGSAKISATPADRLSVTYTIDYTGTPIGVQTWSGEITPKRFEIDIAPARTFGLMEEVEDLRNRGLARGGNLENCVVVSKNTFLTALRFEDEMVRHKVLDILGDIALLDWIPNVHVEAHKGGHRLHAKLARALQREAMEVHK